MLEGKTTIGELFELTSLPRRVISKCIDDAPHICISNKGGKFIVSLKHGLASTNSIIDSSNFNGVAKVSCNALESVVKALDSKEITIKSTDHRVRIFGKNTSVSIFQYPMEEDDIDIIKNGKIGLKMKMKDYILISKYMPKDCDMVIFRGKHIAWKDNHNIYIVDRSVPDPFLLPRGVLKALTTKAKDPDGYVIQSRLPNGDIVFRWGGGDMPEYAIRYKEPKNYEDTHFDERVNKAFMKQVGWMKVPDLRTFQDLGVNDIKWNDHAISSYRNHNYNVVMKHSGTLKSEFITGVPDLPPGAKGVDMDIYEAQTVVMFRIGKWKLYTSTRID